MRRFIDMEMDSLHFPSANEYLKHQPSSLEQALESISPRINQLDQLIQTAKTKCHFPSEYSLTHDESASIFLYTMEWDDNSLYQMIEKDLRSTNRSISQSWFPYLKLFDTALQKLPSHRMKVWRGINEVVCKKLKKGDTFIWRSITSCSSSDDIIKDCLDINFTLCSIEAVNAKDISIYSSSLNQNEVILCPDTQLQVVSNVENKTSSSVLQLRENTRQQSSPSFFENNDIIETISSRWSNNSILSLASHMIVLIIALLIAVFFRNVLITLESSNITTILTAFFYQPLQIIFTSKSKFGPPIIIDQPSTFHIHTDTLGNRYEGEWNDNKKHGKGKMNFANGHKYTGDWVDDMATGEGIFVWTNGDQYEGEVKNGQRHGEGSYYFVNGNKYTGGWIEDKKSGYGTASLALGKYEGEFKNDKMHGKGAFYFTNGDTYVGDWMDDKQEGEGIFKWATGDHYEGGFKAGKLHGNGSYYFGNGNKFTGKWVDGERETDHGSFTWANTTPHPNDNKNRKEPEK